MTYSYPPPAPNPYQGSYAQPQRYNVLAIVGFILAFVVPIAGAICSQVSLGQIKRTGEQGHGLAVAGAIIGWVFTAFGLLIIVFYVILFAAIFSSHPEVFQSFSTNN